MLNFVTYFVNFSTRYLNIYFSGLEERQICNNKKRKTHDKVFRCPGPLHVLSLDGNDKMKGLNNNEFPFGIYGGIDCFSRKILFLTVMVNNRDAAATGTDYFKMLLNLKVCPRFLQVDLGTETAVIAAIHSAIRDQLPGGSSWDKDPKFVIYGPSTSNVTIERFWNLSNTSVVALLKPHLQKLRSELLYDPNENFDRDLLAYLFIPVIQSELDVLSERHNNHRIRKQNGVELPTGCKPNYSFSFPETFGAAQCGREIPSKVLIDVGNSFGISISNESVTIAQDVKAMISECPTTVERAADVYRSVKKKLYSMAAG
jgi:hypothetical protein